jgi:S-adenosylmethionine synthetase
MSGVTTRIHQDGRLLTIDRTQDCEPILEDNKRLQAEPQSRKSPFRHIARIPNVIVEKWLAEEIARGNRTIRWGSKELDELIAKKLKDPAWAYLRTDRKQVFI